MDFFEAVEKRYSHKDAFLPTPIPEEHIDKIVKAGLMAPSGANRQTVRLVVLSRQALEGLCEITSYLSLETAPCAIAILTEKAEDAKNSFEKEDYAAAMENMLLAATALGYASLWLDSPYFNDQKQLETKKYFGVPTVWHLWAVIPIGLPDGPSIKRDKLPFESRVKYI